MQGSNFFRGNTHTKVPMDNAIVTFGVGWGNVPEVIIVAKFRRHLQHIKNTPPFIRQIFLSVSISHILILTIIISLAI